MIAKKRALGIVFSFNVAFFTRVGYLFVISVKASIQQSLDS